MFAANRFWTWWRPSGALPAFTVPVPPTFLGNLIWRKMTQITWRDNVEIEWKGI